MINHDSPSQKYNKEVEMKYLLGLFTVAWSVASYAQVPVLATDIEANEVILSAGYINGSLTQNVKDGSHEIEIDTDVTGKSINVAMAGSSLNGAIPIMSLDASTYSYDDGSEDLNSFDVYLGLALEGDNKKNLILLNYETYNDSAVRDSFGVKGIFGSKASPMSDRENEYVVSIEFQEAIEDVSGGHSAGVSFNSKLPLSNGAYFVSGLGTSLKTDTNYSSGVKKSATGSIDADIGLNIQPAQNISLEFGLGTNLAGYKYYDENGLYALSEIRTILLFYFELNVAL
jgi:hypothetical protein